MAAPKSMPLPSKCHAVGIVCGNAQSQLWALSQAFSRADLQDDIPRLRSTAINAAKLARDSLSMLLEDLGAPSKPPTRRSKVHAAKRVILATLALLGVACASSPTPPPAADYRVISERTFYPPTTYEIRSSTIGAPSPAPAPLPPPKADGGREYYPRTTYERGALTTCDFLAPCSWSASCCFALRSKRGVP